jgi:hypothetical protein
MTGGALRSETPKYDTRFGGFRVRIARGIGSALSSKLSSNPI